MKRRKKYRHKIEARKRTKTKNKLQSIDFGFNEIPRRIRRFMNFNSTFFFADQHSLKTKSEYYSFFSLACANELKSIRIDDFFQSVSSQQLKRNKAVKKYARLHQFFGRRRPLYGCVRVHRNVGELLSARIFSTSHFDNGH